MQSLGAIGPASSGEIKYKESVVIIILTVKQGSDYKDLCKVDS